MIAVVTCLGIAGSGSVGTTATPERSEAVPPRAASEPKCPSARKAVAFYKRRYAEHRASMGVPTAANDVRRAAGRCPRYLAQVWKRKAYAWRMRVERWVDARTLRDFDVRPGYSGWRRAVDEVQRAYPGTKAWLLSCSASEGGWGRWVPNSQGSGVGGWMQMFPSTFWRMFTAARADVRARGYRVPASAASWYSPLGQALGGAWAIRNGRRHEWVGHGC